MKKNQKPIDIDAHFKYRCPNCDINHWISFNQAKTKNYKIVCDCGKVFKPLRIKKLKIVYEVTEQTTKNITTNNTTEHSIPPDLLNKCTTLLISYGFTKAEAESLTKQTFIKTQSLDFSVLIKNILESIGVNHEHSTNNF